MSASGRLPRPLAGPPAVLALTVVALLALLLAWSPEAAQAAPLHIDRLTASPTQAAADGGRITITVTVSDIAPAGETVALATTRGAFGAAAGPTRIVLPVTPGSDGGAVVTAVLVGNGSVGGATITASAFDRSRRVGVRFLGAPATLRFEAPPAGDLPADRSHGVELLVRDITGAPVPGAAITLATDRGRLRASDAAGEMITLASDARGRVRAHLEPELGAVRLTARAGAIVATRELRLLGPPATLQIVSLPETIHLRDDPPGALAVIVRDAIGQFLPGVPVTFTVAPSGLRVVSDAPGGAFFTDADGTVRGRLAFGEGTAPGIVTVTARAAGLESSAALRIAGPPASILLSFTELGGPDFALRVRLFDAAGAPVIRAADVQWAALNVPSGVTVTFTRPQSEAQDGAAATVARVTGDPPAAVTVWAGVAGSDPVVAASATLPMPLPTSGTPLQAGLHQLVWTGPHGSISTIVAPITPVFVSAYRYDLGAGWQSYIPDWADSQDFLVAHGNTIYVRVSQPVRFPGVELAGAAP